MKILFVHQNFLPSSCTLPPGAYCARPSCVGADRRKNQRPSSVNVVRQKAPEELKLPPMLGRTYCEHSERGWLAGARLPGAARQARLYPDVILGHSGWGETLFLNEIFPDAKLLCYAELFLPHARP